uniref:Testis expressed 2, like n=1 Tax=Callorhinchus milii TaxID=7868 RepID=A0A4W3JSF2_CALMI
MAELGSDEKEPGEFLSPCCHSSSLGNHQDVGSEQPVVHQGKDIVIHLTSPTEQGDWENLEENELIFSLEKEDEGEKERTSEEEAMPHPEEHFNLSLPASSLPSSPSHSTSLAQILFSSAPCPVPLNVRPSNSYGSSTDSRPLFSLVKSLSTEIETRDMSSQLPRPLLSLVKSISTEISRHEPEVTQSKSDSKLNLHLWRQLTQPKGRNGDYKTAPPSPLLSPSADSKVSFFKVPEVEAKLEDTKRKFSEAMQEPLNMLSKIIGDESGGSPNKHRGYSQANSFGARSPGVSGAEDGVGVEAGNKGIRSGFEKLRTEILKLSIASRPKQGEVEGSRYEICTYGDMIQIVETEPGEDSMLCGQESTFSSYFSPSSTPPVSSQPVPSKTLICLATLTYSYFVLPLPSYFSGLCLGLALGFLTALLIILLLTPKLSHTTRPASRQLQLDSFIPDPKELEVVKGWMNEIYNYDPEMYHPSLTHSVYVTLEGPLLKLSYPKSKISRWATFDEVKHDVVFISHRSYDLAESKISLVPPGLAKKRMWNKKYPIRILLSEPESEPEDRLMESANQEWKSESDSEDQEEIVDNTRGALTPDVTLRPPSEGRVSALFLFGRTGRDKEEWFRHFLLASRFQSEDSPCIFFVGETQELIAHSRNRSAIPSGRLAHSDCSSRDSTEDLSSLFKTKDLAGNIRQKILLDYNTYMAKFTLSDNSSPLLSPCHSTNSSPTHRKKVGETPVNKEPQVSWINVAIGRIFWDFLREKYWADQVCFKVQKKLSKIRLPYFMNELTLTELDMGTLMPVIISTSSPSVNQKGLWMDLEIAYNGALQMTLETKMNLCKLGKESLPEGVRPVDTGREGSSPRTLVLADSDEESSSAGSSEEDETPVTEVLGAVGDKALPLGAEGYAGGSSTSRKILRFVDKIAKSKYFQKATENEFIKKKIEEVSNTPLLLTVEVQELAGMLAVNIPPPPTDRIWYSFRTPPRLEFKVRPKLGEREVTFTHVTEWIEKKLQHEFQKVFVMPNMDDIYIPIMHSGLDYPAQSSQSPMGPTRETSFDSMERF